MSTVAEIEATLPRLSLEQLLHVEQALHEQYRQRGGNLIYDDAYGALTDADLVAAGDAAFLAYDREEETHDARRHN